MKRHKYEWICDGYIGIYGEVGVSPRSIVPSRSNRKKSTLASLVRIQSRSHVINKLSSDKQTQMDNSGADLRKPYNGRQ